MSQNTNDGILFVDDTKVLLELVSSFARKWGFQAFTAQTGEEAIRILSDNQNIKLVFVDLHLGKDQKNGLELTRILSKFREGRFLKFCILTGDQAKEYQDVAAHYGADAFLLKPVSPTRLKNLIFDLLEVGEKSLVVANQYKIKIGNAPTTILDSNIQPNFFVKEITINSIVLESSARIEEGTVLKIHCPRLGRMLNTSPIFSIKTQKCRSYQEIVKDNGENWFENANHLVGHHDDNFLIRSLIIDITHDTQASIELYHRQLTEKQRKTGTI